MPSLLSLSFYYDSTSNLLSLHSRFTKDDATTFAIVHKNGQDSWLKLLALKSHLVADFKRAPCSLKHAVADLVEAKSVGSED